MVLHPSLLANAIHLIGLQIYSFYYIYNDENTSA